MVTRGKVSSHALHQLERANAGFEVADVPFRFSAQDNTLSGIFVNVFNLGNFEHYRTAELLAKSSWSEARYDLKTYGEDAAFDAVQAPHLTLLVLLRLLGVDRFNKVIVANLSKPIRRRWYGTAPDKLRDLFMVTDLVSLDTLEIALPTSQQRMVWAAQQAQTVERAAQDAQTYAATPSAKIWRQI